MDLDTLDWVPEIADEMGVPLAMLPEIRSSSEVYAKARERARSAGVPIAGILGDQQAATFGQACLEPGEAKNTYGTGNFLLLNTGTEKVMSDNGLLTTVCYALGDDDPVYALEGSIAVTGSLVQWLRDNLGLISRRVRDRGARAHGRRQRRRLLRPGVLRPVRAVLASRRPRRDRRADPLRRARPPRPRGAGGHRVPDPRGGRGDERRFGCRADAR